MANKKITELPAIGALTGTELFETVQGGLNKKGTLDEISDYVIGNIVLSSLGATTQRYNFDINGTVGADYSTNFGSDTDINSAWTFSAAESTVHAIGSNNSASFGWDHLVGDGSSSGSGANSFTAGVDLINYGNGSHVSGHRGRVTYVAATTGGFVHGLGVGYPSTIPYVTAIAGAINVSRNTVAQTDGFGALASDSFIIGGIDGNIPSTSPRSGKIGGGIYNFPASTPDYIAVPNLIIFGTPDTDNALTSVFAYDSTSKKVKLRTVSSIITADNGVKVSSGVVKLGTTLTENTSIPLGAFTLALGNYTFSATNDRIDLGVNRFLQNVVTTDDTSPSLFIGLGSGAAFSGGSKGYANTVVGFEAGKAMTSNVASQASSSTIMGYRAGQAITIASFNTLYGVLAGSALTNTGGNTFLGYHAGINATGTTKVAVGFQALSRNTHATIGTAVGWNALTLSTSGINSAFGHEAGGNISTGTRNTCIGTESGVVITTSNDNTTLGHRAGYAGALGNDNTIIGSFAGVTASGTGNVHLGKDAGEIMTTGNNNIFIGANCAETKTSGGDNIIIGKGISTSTTTATNELNIGGFIKATGLYTTPILTIGSDVKLETAGQGFYVKEGTNATMGVATLVGGTVTVNTTKVTANSRIFLTIQTPGGTVGAVHISARSAGTSFTITSTSGSDTSDVSWIIIEPN